MWAGEVFWEVRQRQVSVQEQSELSCYVFHQKSILSSSGEVGKYHCLKTNMVLNGETHGSWIT